MQSCVISLSDFYYMLQIIILSVISFTAVAASCAEGEYLSGTECTACPKFADSSEILISSVSTPDFSACACPAGYFGEAMDLAAGTISCTTCPAGSSCPGGSSATECGTHGTSTPAGSSQCTCDDGYLLNVDCNHCKDVHARFDETSHSCLCFEGYSGSGTDNSPCVSCQAGSYCPGVI
jgi:hypothetical protein